MAFAFENRFGAATSLLQAIAAKTATASLGSRSVTFTVPARNPGDPTTITRQVPILSVSALIAKRPPPASYPIKNPTGKEPLDAYLPYPKKGRYGGLDPNREWLWLKWREYMLWGTGSDEEDQRVSLPGIGGATVSYRANVAGIALRMMTEKERAYFELDANHSSSWLSRNPAVPAVALSAVGIAASAVAIASSVSAAAAAPAAAAPSVAPAVAAPIATAAPATVVTTAPSLATLAGSGSMVGGFGAGIGGAAAVVPTSLTGIVGTTTAATVATAAIQTTAPSLSSLVGSGSMVGGAGAGIGGTAAVAPVTTVATAAPAAVVTTTAPSLTSLAGSGGMVSAGTSVVGTATSALPVTAGLAGAAAAAAKPILSAVLPQVLKDTGILPSTTPATATPTTPVQLVTTPAASASQPSPILLIGGGLLAALLFS